MVNLLSGGKLFPEVAAPRGTVFWLAMQDWVLEIRDDSGVRQVPLGDAPLTIGRHRDNRLVLPDDKASRFHCVISKSAAGFCVRDLGSSNGTALNGRLLKDESKLGAGDTLIIGKTRMRVIGTNGHPDEEDLSLVVPTCSQR